MADYDFLGFYWAVVKAPFLSRAMDSLGTEMAHLNIARDHVMGRIAFAEREQNMSRGFRVRKWLLEVEAIEHEFASIQNEISEGMCCTGIPIRWRIFKCLENVKKLYGEGDFNVVAYPVAEEDDMKGATEFVTAEDIPLLQKVSLHHVGKHSTTIQSFMSEMAKQTLRQFSLVELERFTRKFSTPLGSGGFADVYHGLLPSDEPIAVKVLKNKRKDIIKEQFMAEVSTIGRTFHRNLVRLYGFCFDAKKRALVYEYMEHGSLDRKLFNAGNLIDWEKIPSIAIGIAKGLVYLHEECPDILVHYDIKPGNILLDSNFSPKIADFGLAKFYGREMTHVSGGRGTFGYAAPEVWTAAWPVTYKCDVFSYGIMLFELVGRRKNKKHAESLEWFPKQVWKKFEKGDVEELFVECGIPSKYREKAKNMFMVALACIQPNPNDRPSMATVVKILEGESEATETPNPFQNLVHLNSNTSADEDLRLPRGTRRVGGNLFSQFMEQYEMTTLSGGNVHINGTLFTPIMRKYEIEMASSSGET